MENGVNMVYTEPLSHLLLIEKNDCPSQLGGIHTVRMLAIAAQTQGRRTHVACHVSIRGMHFITISCDVKVAGRSLLTLLPLEWM